MDHEPLFEQIALALDSRLVGFTELLGGSSANVWRLDLDGMQVVFRQHRASELKNHSESAARKEFQLLEVLHRHGFPVARPLHLDEPHRCLVTEFVSGGSTVGPQALPAAIDQMADLLARLHAFDVALLADAELDPLEDPIQRLRTCLPDSSSGRQLETLLDNNAIRVHTNTPVLIHGDYWPGNFLWKDQQLAALIDWEDAWMGEPLADLACARVELLCQFGEAAMERFTLRYLEQAAPLDTRSLPLWQCYVSATALASMHLWGLSPVDETSRRATTLEFFTRAVQALSI